MNKLLLTFVLFVATNSFGYHTKFADSLQREANQISGQSGLNFMLDNFYIVFNKNYEDGVEWATFAKQLALNNRFKQEEGRANLSLGVIHYLHGDYEKAISHYQGALDIFEAINDLKYLGRTHNELTVYMRKQSQFEDALQHVKQALKYCNECSDYECVETAFNNQGVVFEMQGNYTQAKNAYQMAERIALENNNQVGLGYIYNNFAELAHLAEDYDSMAFYLEKSINIRETLNDIQGVAINHSNLGEMYLLTEQYEQAEFHLQKSLAMAQEVQYPDLQQHVLGLLFELNLKQGQSNQALLNNEKRNIIKDSLLNLEKIARLREMEVRYNTEKIRVDYLEEQQSRIETEVTLKNRNLWIVGIGGSLLAITFFSLFMYQRKK
jgi:tetratricopeptide (TPR) repeat protein